MVMYYDLRKGVLNKGETITVSSYNEIEKYIKQLDQAVYTEITLKEENNSLMIYGGKGKYIVIFVKGADEEFFVLANDENNENEIDIVAGGQLITFAQNKVIDYDLTIEASRYYFENKAMKPGMAWVKD